MIHRYSFLQVVQLIVHFLLIRLICTDSEINYLVKNEWSVNLRCTLAVFKRQFQICDPSPFHGYTVNQAPGSDFSTVGAERELFTFRFHDSLTVPPTFPDAGCRTLGGTFQYKICWQHPDQPLPHAEKTHKTHARTPSHPWNKCSGDCNSLPTPAARSWLWLH